jgi:hypothetical protein
MIILEDFKPNGRDIGSSVNHTICHPSGFCCSSPVSELRQNIPFPALKIVFSNQFQTRKTHTFAAENFNVKGGIYIRFYHFGSAATNLPDGYS